MTIASRVKQVPASLTIDWLTFHPSLDQITLHLEGHDGTDALPLSSLPSAFTKPFAEAMEALTQHVASESGLPTTMGVPAEAEA